MAEQSQLQVEEVLHVHTRKPKKNQIPFGVAF